MPITRSAKKALRTSLKKRDFNLAKKTAVSKAVKAVKKLSVEGKKKEAMAALSLAQKALDKAVKTHALDKNTASRRKSRLSKMLKKLK
ncbi:30S ribosomal protein S20 [Candidatus Parcubacteria bacterium]|nr:30S ribosomal protein S20 [Candidatus Parcubacteria bacterium]